MPNSVKYSPMIFHKKNSAGYNKNASGFLLIFAVLAFKIYLPRNGGILMADEYGSDFITIVDEDGTEFELEVLTTIEYNGETYLAVTPATDEEDVELEISILKSVEEDGESILCAIEDDQELETVEQLIMDQLYEDEDTDE